MKIHNLQCEVWLPRPLEEVFRFFADAGNLERLTPPWVNFRILTLQPIHMGVGTRIQYRLRIRGIPVRWESEITAWRPPHFFADDQVNGPYRLWHHEHSFASRDGGTLARGLVTYAVPGGALVNRCMVEPDLKRIFAFRQNTLKEIFG
jgi:ligand-binding SRPBCC domain-containing protein